MIWVTYMSVWLTDFPFCVGYLLGLWSTVGLLWVYDRVVRR